MKSVAVDISQTPAATHTALAHLTSPITPGSPPPPQQQQQQQQRQRRARIEFTTDFGVIQFALRPDLAPRTCTFMARLVAGGWYDGCVFYRAEAEFVVQGGLPQGADGLCRQVPPSVFGGGALPLEWHPELRNRRGTVTMARWEDPNSGAGEFFFNLSDAPHLDRTGDSGWSLGFAVFGEVERGSEDVISSISELPTTDQGGLRMLDEPVLIHRATFHQAVGPECEFPRVEGVAPPPSPLPPPPGGSVIGSVKTPLRMIVLCGLPGSGKSTITRRLLARVTAALEVEVEAEAGGEGSPPKTWRVVCQDELGSRDACERRAAAHLAAGDSVVVDRCNFDRHQREHWVDIFRRSGCRGAPIAVWLDPPCAVCERRVANRRGHPTLPPGGKSVGIVRKFAGMFRPPRKSEGFGAVVRIDTAALADDGEAAESKWGDDDRCLDTLLKFAVARTTLPAVATASSVFDAAVSAHPSPECRAMMDMGFEQSQCELALSRTDNSVDRAVSHCLESILP